MPVKYWRGGTHCKPYELSIDNLECEVVTSTYLVSTESRKWWNFFSEMRKFTMCTRNKVVIFSINNFSESITFFTYLSCVCVLS